MNPTIELLSLHLDIPKYLKPIIGDNIIFTLLNKKEITSKDFKTNAGRIRFTNEGIKKIELKMIKRLTEQTMIGEQKLTWRQVIRREINQIKKTIVEGVEYKPFIAKI